MKANEARTLASEKMHDNTSELVNRIRASIRLAALRGYLATEVSCRQAVDRESITKILAADGYFCEWSERVLLIEWDEQAKKRQENGVYVTIGQPPPAWTHPRPLRHVEIEPEKNTFHMGLRMAGEGRPAPPQASEVAT